MNKTVLYFCCSSVSTMLCNITAFISIKSCIHFWLRFCIDLVLTILSIGLSSVLCGHQFIHEMILLLTEPLFQKLSLVNVGIVTGQLGSP